MPSARSLSIAGATMAMILSAERTVLASVRIESGDGEARMVDAKPRLQIARHDASRLDDEIKRQLVSGRP